MYKSIKFCIYLAVFLYGSDFVDALTQQQDTSSANRSCRRNFLQKALLTGSAAIMLTIPTVANAEYGMDAKMSFPDVLAGMNDRATKQCLVESLGNRECLVYMEDAEKFLYKGADMNTLISRIQASTNALDQIPPLVEAKKWNAVNGILTGPMGQLSQSLTMISSVSSNPKVTKEKAQNVKQDLFAMGTANTSKKGDEVLKYQKKAIDDLAIILQSL